VEAVIHNFQMKLSPRLSKGESCEQNILSKTSTVFWIPYLSGMT